MFLVYGDILAAISLAYVVFGNTKSQIPFRHIESFNVGNRSIVDPISLFYKLCDGIN